MKNKTLIIISILLSFILIILFKDEHFALDSYTFANDINSNASWYLINGRVFMFIFLKICLFLNLTDKSIKTISLIISIITLFCSNIILNKMLSKHINNRVFNSIISTAFIYSPFIIELFIFSEFTGIMCLSILFSTISVKYLNMYFNNKKIYNLLLSFLFATFCACSYQGTMGVFSSLAILFSCINYKKIKCFIKEQLYIIGIYGIASLISLTITKIMGLERLEQNSFNIIKTIKGIIKGTAYLLINTSKIFPKYFFILITLIIIVFIIIDIIRKKNYKIMLIYLYLIFMIIAFSIAPQLLVDYHSIWIVPRSNICMAFLPIAIATLVISNNSSINSYNKAILIVITIMLVMQFIGWYSIRQDHYLTNNNDKQETIEILKYIDKHNENDDIKVRKIGMAEDASITYSYKNVSTSMGDINKRGYSINWVRSTIIDYYSNKKYQFIEPNEQFKSYCSSNNWDYLNEDLFKIENDVLYICIY